MKVKELIERIEDYPDNDVAFLLDGTEIHSKFIAKDGYKNATILVFDFVDNNENEWVI